MMCSTKNEWLSKSCSPDINTVFDGCSNTSTFPLYVFQQCCSLKLPTKLDIYRIRISKINVYLEVLALVTCTIDCLDPCCYL